MALLVIGGFILSAFYAADTATGKLVEGIQKQEWLPPTDLGVAMQASNSPGFSASVEAAIVTATKFNRKRASAAGLLDKIWVRPDGTIGVRLTISARVVDAGMFTLAYAVIATVFSRG